MEAGEEATGHGEVLTKYRQNEKQDFGTDVSLIVSSFEYPCPIAPETLDTFRFGLTLTPRLLTRTTHFRPHSENRIDQLCHNKKNVKQPASLAKALEARLFVSCSSLEEYANLSTLERRLRDVSMVAGRSIEKARTRSKKSIVGIKDFEPTV